MNLEDMYSWPELVVAEAPVIGPDQHPMKDDREHGLIDPNFLDQLVSTDKKIEGNTLFALKINDDIGFQLRNNDGEVLTTLVAQIINNFPGLKKRDTIIISRTETPTSYRGMGYSPSLIDGLTNLGYRIVSDSQVSPAAQRVWDKLELIRDVKYWDNQSKRYTVGHPKGNPNIHYVLERFFFRPSSKIVNDPSFWTHPNIKQIIENKI